MSTKSKRIKITEKVSLYAILNEPTKKFVGFSFNAQQNKGLVYAPVGYSQALKFTTRKVAASTLRYIKNFDKNRNAFYKCKTLIIIKLRKRVIYMEKIDG